MKIIMLRTAPGSEDGIRVQSYAEGQTYEVGEALGRAFCDSGAARLVEDDKPTAGTKRAKGPSENK
jgi:hypothetical protein